MARPGGQRGSRGQPPKRKKRDEFFEDEDAVDFFEDAGDNQAGEEADEGEPSSDEEETAEQKRLRLGGAPVWCKLGRVMEPLPGWSGPLTALQ